MKHVRIRMCVRFVVAVVCGVNAAQSLAQGPKSGQISGHVVDVAGATIQGASVFVRRNIPYEDDVKLLMHTDTSGYFNLVLPEGGYDVLVTSPGFAASVESVPVWAGKIKKLRWKLKPLGCSFPGISCDPVQSVH